MDKGETRAKLKQEFGHMGEQIAFGHAFVRSQRHRKELAVDLAAMSDFHGENQEAVVLDGVDDTVVADANAPGPVLTLEIVGSGWSRLRLAQLSENCRYRDSFVRGIGIVWPRR
jgi:hypothetical protein